MAKPLIFNFADGTLPLSMTKVDRTKLYGYKEIEVLDESQHKCELATLAEDGRTVVGKGGTAMAYLDVDGNWCERNEIKPVNLEGEEMTPVPSSFSAPIELGKKVSSDEYLEHSIRLVYKMELGQAEDENPRPTYDQLCKQLKDGAIFSFPYSYRGGLTADAGFLLMNQNDEVFFVVGERSTVEMLSLQQSAAVASEDVESDASAESLMDFDMI